MLNVSEKCTKRWRLIRQDWESSLAMKFNGFTSIGCLGKTETLT